jgi:uncharacterized RDD family membrane protein YckC
MWAMHAATHEGAKAPASVRVAGFWRRAAAGMVDAAILLALFLLLDVMVSLILRHPLPRLRQLGPDYLLDIAVNGDALAVTGLVVLAILGFLYFFIFHALKGRTPGKQLLGLRVIDGYGQRPSFLRALVRTAAYVPSTMVLALGFVWIGFDREKRGLHDWVADTYVIKGAA